MKYNPELPRLVGATVAQIQKQMTIPTGLSRARCVLCNAELIVSPDSFRLISDGAVNAVCDKCAVAKGPASVIASRGLTDEEKKQYASCREEFARKN